MPTGAKAFFALCMWICAIVAMTLSLPMLLGWTEATGTIGSLVDNSECRGDPNAPVVTLIPRRGGTMTISSSGAAIRVDGLSFADTRSCRRVPPALVANAERSNSEGGPARLCPGESRCSQRRIQ